MYDEHFEVYGVRKVWRQLRREGESVARCTVSRLMRRMGLQGAVRGRRVKTTRAVVHGERPDDRVNREFQVWTPPLHNDQVSTKAGQVHSEPYVPFGFRWSGLPRSASTLRLRGRLAPPVRLPARRTRPARRPYGRMKFPYPNSPS